MRAALMTAVAEHDALADGEDTREEGATNRITGASKGRRRRRPFDVAELHGGLQAQLFGAHHAVCERVVLKLVVQAGKAGAHVRAGIQYAEYAEGEAGQYAPADEA